MELMTQNAPMSAEFTAATHTRIVSDAGNMCSIFEAGQTKRIPKDLFKAALLAGLVPEEVLIIPDTTTAPGPKLTQEQIVSVGLAEACRTLIARGDKQDFTAMGRPRTASAKKLVDFNFTARELDVAFDQAMHEVDQDGDNDEEHSDSGSDLTI